ncbi:MAG TPA: SDR family oxidoreductase [Candidatus Binataceae bacterium]|nr:SDR family oxidoreductase [Candidatus Binataceae bacterium]
MGRLDGKVAVISGAASGIGRAAAIRFAAEGAALVIADLNAEGGAEVTRECISAGGRAVFQPTNVEQESDIKAAIDRAGTEFGRLDVMYNNAGLGGAVGPIEETTLENWDRTMAILLRSVFLGMKHAIPVMRAQGGGSIISTASVAGFMAGAPHAYSTAKAGVINLTRSVAMQVGKDRIRVNCICPGLINTPLVYNHIPGGAPVAAEFFAKTQPIPRIGKPEDIAAMALFLASDESEWITGAAMIVDGGIALGGNMFGANSPIPAPPAGFSGPSFQRRR